jgi:hypothetical protein
MTVESIARWEPVSDHNQLPGTLDRPLAANEQAGKGQLVSVSRSTGYAQLNDGTVPNQIPAGNAELLERSDKSATAGNASIRVSDRWSSGLPMGATTDGFTNADFGVPCYIKDGSSVGKLSHTGADATLVNRSFLGMVYGINEQNGTPFVWPGPVAFEIARSATDYNAKVMASTSFALTANTTKAETIIPRLSLQKGRATSVRIATLAGFTGHDVNYWTFTVSKRTATTPGTAVVIATKTTKLTGGTGTLAAFAYAELTIASGVAADILETDTITVTCTAESTAAAITQLTVEVIAKVG